MPADVLYLVERYLPLDVEPGLEALGALLAAATAELRAEGGRIRWLHSLALPEDESCICVFRATTRELVAEANDRAGLSYERISPAVAVGEL